MADFKISLSAALTSMILLGMCFVMVPFSVLALSNLGGVSASLFFAVLIVAVLMLNKPTQAMLGRRSVRLTRFIENPLNIDCEKKDEFGSLTGNFLKSGLVFSLVLLAIAPLLEL